MIYSKHLHSGLSLSLQGEYFTTGGMVAVKESPLFVEIVSGALGGCVDFLCTLGTSYATLWHESTDSCSCRNKIYSEGFFLRSIMTSNEGILLSWVEANTHGPKQSLLLGMPKLMNQIKLPDNFLFFVYLFNSSWKGDHQ